MKNVNFFLIVIALSIFFTFSIGFSSAEMPSIVISQHNLSQFNDDLGIINKTAVNTTHFIFINDIFNLNMSWLTSYLHDMFYNKTQSDSNYCAANGSNCLQTPSYLNLTVGNSTGNITIGNSGDIKLNGIATQWDDMQASLATARTGTLRIPTWTSFKNGTYALAFADQSVANNQEEAFVSLQMSHSYKQGTDIDCHIHWACGTASNNNVTWGLEVTKADISGTFGNTQTYYATQSCGTAYQHRLADFHSIGNFSSISGIAQMRIFRNSSGVADNYAGSDVFGLSLDCHYEKDRLGSNEEYIK